MPSPAELFDALDGRFLYSGNEIWQITIYSIREEQGQLWIQLGLNEGGGAALSPVVRTPLGKEPAQILEGLEEWLARSDRGALRTVELD